MADKLNTLPPVDPPQPPRIDGNGSSIVDLTPDSSIPSLQQASNRNNHPNYLTAVTSTPSKISSTTTTKSNGTQKLLDEMVILHLTDCGFSRTAAVFSKALGISLTEFPDAPSDGGCESMESHDSDTPMVDAAPTSLSPSNPNQNFQLYLMAELEDAKHRHGTHSSAFFIWIGIRELILNGNIEGALGSIQLHYPTLLSLSGSISLFQLRSQKFVEMINDNLNAMEDLSTVGEIASPLQRILDYGQKLQDDYCNDTRDEVTSNLNVVEIFNFYFN